jgi:hypothetical protein
MLLEEFSILTYSEGGVADLVGHNRAALRSGLQKCHFRTARNVRIDRENVLHAEHKRDPIRAWRTMFFPFGVAILINKTQVDRLHDVLIGF